MGWRILVVDDEEPAREELLYMLEDRKGIDQIIQASTGMEAIKKAKDHQPDLIFLDINLPDINGLQVAEIANEMQWESRIVFLTAYDQYAIEAFKLRAYHYILKPYDDEDLDVLFKQLDNKIKNSPETSSGNPFKLAIEMEGGIKYLSPKDIIYISKIKDGKYVTMHTKEKTFEASYTLAELEKKLAVFDFFRVHKSFLVNLQYAIELQPYFQGTYNLHLENKTHTVVPVSRNYVKELRSKLEL